MTKVSVNIKMEYPMDEEDLFTHLDGSGWETWGWGWSQVITNAEGTNVLEIHMDDPDDSDLEDPVRSSSRSPQSRSQRRSPTCPRTKPSPSVRGETSVTTTWMQRPLTSSCSGWYSERWCTDELLHRSHQVPRSQDPCVHQSAGRSGVGVREHDHQ